MIGIGLVGYGYWGPNLARCVSETAGCRLAAIADASDKSRERAGQRYPSAQLYSTWDEMLKDPDVDAVLIATPVRTHYDIAAAALTALALLPPSAPPADPTPPLPPPAPCGRARFGAPPVATLVSPSQPTTITSWPLRRWSRTSSLPVGSPIFYHNARGALLT